MDQTNRPQTVRTWAHLVLNISGCRADDYHTKTCDRIAATLVEFGPWWVDFVRANQEANKDKQPQVAGNPYEAPTLTPVQVERGSTWRKVADPGKGFLVEVLDVIAARPAPVVRYFHPNVDAHPEHQTLADFLAQYVQVFSARRTVPKEDPGRASPHFMAPSAEREERRAEEAADADVGPPTLLQQLASVINRGSRENESNTPDFILASFMGDALQAFERTTQARDAWYGMDPRPGKIRDAAMAISTAPDGGRGDVPQQPVAIRQAFNHVDPDRIARNFAEDVQRAQDARAAAAEDVPPPTPPEDSPPNRYSVAQQVLERIQAEANVGDVDRALKLSSVYVSLVGTGG